MIVEFDGRPLEIHQALELALVARLALEPARVVAAERLIDDLWGEKLPRNPMASLQSLVYRSRRSLGQGAAAIRTAGNGYLLEAEPEQVDSSRFESLLSRANRTALLEDPQVRRTMFREALALWNGPALAGLEVPFVVSQRARLETARLVAVQERLQADLDCGAHREVIGELEGLVRDHPDEERLWGQLMLALYRSGSQGAALRACNRLRRHLVEELGVNPSPEICDLEKAILLQDPALAWLPSEAQIAPVATIEQKGSTREGIGTAGHDPVPTLQTSRGPHGSEPVRPGESGAVADLIRAARRTSTSGKYPRRSDFLPFVGREEQLDALAHVIEAASREADVKLAVVEGDAGCGKTRLLNELAARAHVDDRVVVLTSAEDDDVLPYRAFADLVREVLASSLASTYLEQLGPLVGDLAWLVPKALSPPAPPMADARLARMRLFEAVVELSNAAAKRQELAFLVDDAHSMGSETAALLAQLLNGGGEKLTIVLAARGDVGSTSRGYSDLLRRHQPVRVGVGPLAREDVEELAAWCPTAEEGHANSTDASMLYSRTAGVPLLLSTLLTGQAPMPGGPGRVDINSLVEGRTRNLSIGVRKMLHVAALMGSDVSPSLIANVTGADSRLVRRALDRVVDRGGLLDPGRSEGEYAWRHSLVRQAVIDSLEPPAMRQFQEALGDAWAGQGEPLRAAWQSLEVLRTIEATTYRLLIAVVDGIDEALRALAFEVAEDLATQALTLCGRSVDPSILVGLLNRLGRSFAYRAKRDDAMQAWEDAAQIARNEGKPELLAEVALATEPYARSTVDFPLRWSLLNELLPKVTHLESSTQVHVISAWVNEGTVSNQGLTDVSVGNHALTLARAGGDDALLATALTAMHNARRAMREIPIDMSRELCEVADRLADRAWVAQARVSALMDAVSLADLDLAESNLGALMSVVDSGASPRAQWEAAMICSSWALLHGDEEASDRHAKTAFETGERYGIEDARLAFAVHLFFRSFHDGTLDRLAEPLSQFANEHPRFSAWRAGAGLALAAAGDAEGAGAARDEVVPQLLVPSIDPTWPIAACVTAQLCWDTKAPAEQTEPLLQALSHYPGRIAVLGRFVGEFGPVDRYLGLLAIIGSDPRARNGWKQRLR